MRRNLLAVAMSMAFVGAGLAMAAGEPIVGTQSMFPTKNIVENAVNSKVHTTLVSAVKAAGLVETLSKPGTFTVFAPTNDAFEDVDEQLAELGVKAKLSDVIANKELLTKVLTYHVIGEKLTSKTIAERLAAGGGRFEVKTVAGDTLTIRKNGDRNAVLEDQFKQISNITTYDVEQSNGVIHVIDRVVLPKL